MLELQGLKEAVRDGTEEYLEGGKKKGILFVKTKTKKTLQYIVSRGRGRQWEPLVRLTHQFLVLIYLVVPAPEVLAPSLETPKARLDGA